MAVALRVQVRRRARDLCEYCRLPQACTILPHEIDHIRPRKHRGTTTMQNTCWSCAQCNGAKGSNATGFDPLTDELVPLFNPRLNRWGDHFQWSQVVLKGKTAIARATIDVLRINRADRVEHRRLLKAAGLKFST